MEADVETALVLLLAEGKSITSDTVKRVVSTTEVAAPEMASLLWSSLSTTACSLRLERVATAVPVESLGIMMRALKLPAFAGYVEETAEGRA